MRRAEIPRPLSIIRKLASEVLPHARLVASLEADLDRYPDILGQFLSPAESVQRHLSLELAAPSAPKAGMRRVFVLCGSG